MGFGAVVAVLVVSRSAACASQQLGGRVMPCPSLAAPGPASSPRARAFAPESSARTTRCVARPSAGGSSSSAQVPAHTPWANGRDLQPRARERTGWEQGPQVGGEVSPCHTRASGGGKAPATYPVRWYGTGQRDRNCPCESGHRSKCGDSSLHTRVWPVPRHAVLGVGLSGHARARQRPGVSSASARADNRAA